MPETTFTDSEIERAVQSVNADILRNQRARRVHIKPLPQPAYKPAPQPEPASWDAVQKHVHEGLLCLYVAVSVGIVGAAIGAVWFFMGRQGG